MEIFITLAALVGLVWAAGLYLCRCNCRPDAVGEPVTISAEELRAHVQTLASEIGERNVLYPQKLRQAADYIEQVWRAQGYEVHRQEFVAFQQTCVNLEVTVRGAERPKEIILVGAHYDSPDNSPGANDNASGVAALLELSRLFACGSAAVSVAGTGSATGSVANPSGTSPKSESRGLAPPSRTIRFVAFTNEELFKMPEMGSRHYARAARQRGDDLRAVMVLETIGYYSDRPGSQRYPPLLSFFYPNRGDFIAFVSNMRSRRLLHDAVAAFRGHSDFPIECASLPEAVPGVDWSDHWSFWCEGYRAFMVTDTAPYRYPHYHTAQDTPDKVNYEALARVTAGLYGVICALAAQR